jgi:hypothetical protein
MGPKDFEGGVARRVDHPRLPFHPLIDEGYFSRAEEILL